MRVSFVHLFPRISPPPKFRPAIDLPEMLQNERPTRPEQGVSEPTNSEYDKSLIKTSLIAKYLDRNDPLLHDDFFGVKDWFNQADLMQARVHYAHKQGTLHPNMKHYVYAHRLGVCVFDLRHTEQHLHRALNFMAHLAFRDGIFLFMAHDRAHMHQIENTAIACGEYAHTREWKQGTFANTNLWFGGIDIRLPDCIVMTRTQAHVCNEHPVVTEAAKMCIPSVAVVDSNCSPNQITYPIPGNDDSTVAVEFYLRLFAQAINAGKQARRRLELGETLLPVGQTSRPLVIDAYKEQMVSPPIEAESEPQVETKQEGENEQSDVQDEGVRERKPEVIEPVDKLPPKKTQESRSKLSALLHKLQDNEQK